VKPSAFAYHDPRSCDDLMALPAKLDNAKLLAGGQSLMPMLNLRLVAPDHLIDIGVKSAGEGGTIPAAACVISAIEDALGSRAPPITMHPVSPENILEWLKTIKA